MLSYDEVWSTFLDNYKVNDKDVSHDDEAIYNDIRNAVMHFNQRMRTQYVCDDTSETISGASTYDDRLLIAHYIRLVYLINSRTLYTTLYQPISPDVGIRNYSSQMTALTNSISRQESMIENFIFNSREGFM